MAARFADCRAAVADLVPDVQMIVVDDGSTPAVNEIEARAIVGERLTLHRHDLPKGVAAARTEIGRAHV